VQFYSRAYFFGGRTPPMIAKEVSSPSQGTSWGSNYFFVFFDDAAESCGAFFPVSHRLLAWLAAWPSLWVFVPPIPVLSLFFLSCLGEFVVFTVLFR
jgi:hypothetical protein